VPSIAAQRHNLHSETTSRHRKRLFHPPRATDEVGCEKLMGIDDSSARGDGLDQAGQSGRVQRVAVSTWKPDLAERLIGRACPFRYRRIRSGADAGLPSTERAEAVIGFTAGRAAVPALPHVDQVAGSVCQS